MQNYLCSGLLFAACLLIGSCSREYTEFSTISHCETPSPPGQSVNATWLGTAGVLIEDGRTGILIDPFVSRSRAGLSRLARDVTLIPNADQIRRTVERLVPVDLRGIVVTHSHYDHVMDVPGFARETGATVYGSVTTQQIMRGHGLPKAGVVVADPKRIERFGAFSLEFVPSDHAGIIPGYVPWKGKLSADEDPPVYPGPASHYPMGDVFALRITHRLGEIIFFGSAGSLPGMHDRSVKHENGVVSILGLSGAFDRETYIDEAVANPKADVVVPIHFDNLFRPPATPLQLLSSAKMQEFNELLGEKHPDVLFMPIPPHRACAILPVGQHKERIW